MGSLLMQFSQFNSFMLQMKILEIQQAKRLGIKFTPKNMFSRIIQTPDGKIHKAGDTIDPNIANRMLVDWWIDSIGITLGQLQPGFRAQNPVNAAIIKPLSFIAQMIVFNDTPDDWDLRDWVFGILSFWLGLGYTIPAQIIANVSGKFGFPIPLLTSKDGSLVPINPRVSNFLYKVVKGLTEGGRSTPNYLTDQLIRFLFSFNAFTPVKRSYYKGETKEFQRRSLPEKGSFFFEEGRFLKILVPVLNVADASKE